MIFQYIPTRQIIIDGVVLEFLEQRDMVRKKLGVNYREDNQIIDLGDNASSISQRRDIYRNTNNSDNFFFLNYNQNDRLRDIEIHYCDKVKIFDIFFDFEENIDSIAAKLMRYSEYNERREGEYIFNDLKIVIMNKDQMGGEGNSLGYVYCTSDVTHLSVESGSWSN